MTTRSSPIAGMELQVPGSGVQAATAPKCAILVCALHSSVGEFHVF